MKYSLNQKVYSIDAGTGSLSVEVRRIEEIVLRVESTSYLTHRIDKNEKEIPSTKERFKEAALYENADQILAALNESIKKL